MKRQVILDKNKEISLLMFSDKSNKMDMTNNLAELVSENYDHIVNMAKNNFLSPCCMKDYSDVISYSVTSNSVIPYMCDKDKFIISSSTTRCANDSAVGEFSTFIYIASNDAQNFFPWNLLYLSPKWKTWNVLLSFFK